MQHSISAVPLFMAVLVAIIAAVTDVWRFKVYNMLTFPVLFAGIAYHGLVEGWAGVAHSAGGAGFGLAVLLLPYLLGGLGAGDVKFTMALGAWLGMMPLVPVVLFGCVAVTIYGLVLAYRTSGLRSVWISFQVLLLRFMAIGRVFAGDDAVENIHTWTQRDGRRGRLIPFSAMIAVGLVVTLVLTYFTTHGP